MRRLEVATQWPDFRQELINYAKDVKYFVLPEREKFEEEALAEVAGAQSRGCKAPSSLQGPGEG